MNRNHGLLLAAVAGLLALPGCCCHHRRCDGGPPPAPAPCGPCTTAGPQPPPLNPAPLPPGPPPTTEVPPPAYVPPPSDRPAEVGPAVPTPPAPTPPPTPPPPSPPGAIEPPPSPPGPGSPGARLLPPGSRREAGSITPPETREPPVASVPPRPTPRVAEEREAPPLDIPGFALALPRLASGQQPFPDGVDWLKARGYKAVLHIRPPGEENAAARRQFEGKGLRYLTLEVSPATLSKDVVDRFNRLVADPANLPLFVYDKDSAVLGGLWFLYFRLQEKASDEKARAEAARLGFRSDEEGEHRTMWVAVQKLLSTLGR